VITGFALVCLTVGDLDEAKRFYVDVLGFEVGIDREMDGFRWLTVHVPGRPELPMMLVVPGPPAVEEPIAGQLRSLMARGYLGIGALSTDDCLTEEPEERFYGVDAAFRDPFGNHWRLTQPKTLDEIRDGAP
jgi:catechol 2,3-dioxygenase-like lactoylglutathione lyase family enzyme